MGFFSKVWKGIKKGFKKIGKAIKKGFKKFGKFMGKIGILGQIAMSFILPGIGGLLMKGLGSMLGLGSNITSLSGLAGNLAAKKGFMGALGKGLQAGLKVVNGVTKPFTTITEGITTLSKTAINRVGNIFGRQTPIFSKGLSEAAQQGQFFGSDGVLREVGRTLKPSSMVQSVKDFNMNLDATRTNAEALNVLKDADPAAFKGWSATPEGVLDPTMDKYRTITTPAGIEKDFRGLPHPYGATDTLQQYEYTPLSPANVPGTPVYTDIEKYTNVPVGSIPEGATEAAQSLLGKAWDKVTELPGQAAESTAQSIAEFPGQALITKAKEEFGLGPERYESQPVASTFNIQTPSYGAVRQEVDSVYPELQDPNVVAQLGYQGDDPFYHDWYNNSLTPFGAGTAYQNWMAGRVG